MSLSSFICEFIYKMGCLFVSFKLWHICFIKSSNLRFFAERIIINFFFVEIYSCWNIKKIFFFRKDYENKWQRGTGEVFFCFEKLNKKVLTSSFKFQLASKQIWFKDNQWYWFLETGLALTLGGSVHWMLGFCCQRDSFDGTQITGPDWPQINCFTLL